MLSAISQSPRQLPSVKKESGAFQPAAAEQPAVPQDGVEMGSDPGGALVATGAIVAGLSIPTAIGAFAGPWGILGATLVAGAMDAAAGRYDPEYNPNGSSGSSAAAAAVLSTVGYIAGAPLALGGLAAAGLGLAGFVIYTSLAN